MNPEEFCRGGYDRTWMVDWLVAIRGWSIADRWSAFTGAANSKVSLKLATFAVCECMAPLQPVDEEHRGIRDSFDGAEWQQELISRTWQPALQAKASEPLQTNRRAINPQIIRCQDITKFYQSFELNFSARLPWRRSCRHRDKGRRHLSSHLDGSFHRSG